MNLITDTFRGLVRKKLWPVALLLVAALVAVPMLLAKDPATPITNAPPASKEEGMPSTFVSVVEDGEETERRRVLGKTKDPFAPAPLSKKTKAALKKAKAKEKAAADKSKADSAGSKAKGGGGGAADAGGGAKSEPPASDAPAPTKTHPLYSIKVKFGAVDSEDDLESKVFERQSVLPNEDTPLLVYRGVEEGGKVAVFELTGSVTAQGDGGCEPSPEDCQILRLREGETQFITVTDTGTETDAQYQLELEKIYRSKTAVASAKSLSRSTKRASL